jgi:putative flavoprotein involved in K+ transport
MEHLETVVVGAGQSGLAAGYHLAQRGLPFVILDAGEQVGDTWRSRWDSLRLFTPGRFSSLPGYANPAGPAGFAGKEEFADYLAAYAERFALPVRCGVRVHQAVVRGDGFELDTSAGPVAATHLVVAAGHTGLPHRPSFAEGLDGGIRQLHASEYRNPRSTPGDTVLVVGAGTSGAEIALELAATRTVVLAGRPTPHIPDAVFRYAGRPYWFLVDRLLTIDTPPGRRVAAGFGRRGAPLIRVSMRQVEDAGVTRVPAVTGVTGGQPRTVDGPLPRVDTVIWATGYRPDLRWLPPLDVDDVGVPRTDRGVAADLRGLYFLGLPFQYALTSALIGGVGRDAAYIADRIAREAAVPVPQRT